MFKVGDLVRHKASSIQRDRYNPLKKFGIVVAIESQQLKSLWGTKENLIIVRWIPWNKEQKVAEVCLEQMVEK